MAETQRTFRAVVAYDGTRFAGFQSQPSVRTVQDELEHCLASVLKTESRLVAAGRTDAGVHARGQVIRFSTANRIPADKVPLALNRLLPADVVVRSARVCEAAFHPRFDAVERTYCYRIDNEPIPNVLTRRYAWHVRQPLDVSAMQQAADSLLGTHDFAAFNSAGSDFQTTTRTLTRFECRRLGDEVTILVSANAFLYRMVRNLVGCLREIGSGRQPVTHLAAVCESRSRQQCSAPAPPHGLCLTEVKYQS